MDPGAALRLVALDRLTRLTAGHRDVGVALIDGPVARNHPDLATENIRELAPRVDASTGGTMPDARDHGTFVAGVLSGRRGSGAPAICPECTLIVRPIFGTGHSGRFAMTVAAPEELAAAVVDCVHAGARVLNLSVAVLQPSRAAREHLAGVLQWAARQGVIVVAAAGNQGTIGDAVLPCFPYVIPVVACDGRGRPLWFSNLGSSIGARGLAAPGDAIESLDGSGHGMRTLGGTSAAVPFVTGAVALLWSVYREAAAADVLGALLGGDDPRRTSIVPPLLNAWRAFERLTDIRRRGWSGVERQCRRYVPRMPAPTRLEHERARA